jgi:hypothetical protein
MANLIIKSSANDLVIQGSDNSPAITVGTDGATTFAEATTLSGATTCSTTLGVTGNTTLSGTANNLGTVTQGSLEGTAWRRFNGLMRYTADSSHSSTTAHWEDLPQEAQISGRVGFLRNPDSCMTHTDSTQTITINSAGYYFVYATFIPVTAAAHQITYVRKNGVDQTDNRSGGTVSHGSSVSCLVMNMAVNDTIDVRSESGIHKGPYGNIVIFKIGE